MTSAEPGVPSFVMDQPALHTLVQRFAESERLRAFVADPRPARVSEPLLPLFLAAVWLERGGSLVCVLPDDADARDAAEAAGWFLGEERVGLLASRGVRWASSPLRRKYPAQFSSLVMLVPHSVWPLAQPRPQLASLSWPSGSLQVGQKRFVRFQCVKWVA